MGIRDLLFGSRPAVVPDGAQLRELLFRAAEAGDRDQLEGLCRSNREGIARQFPEWQNVPAEARAEPAALQRYARGLTAVAEVFAERLAAPELLERLIGPAHTNPINKWLERLRRAQQLMDEMCYPEAQESLRGLLVDVRGLQGSGPDAYLPITLGRLGECYFQGGEAEKALAPFEQALELCVRTGDDEGVAAHLGNLYEAHRYLGQGDRAADYCGQLVDALDRLGRGEEGSRYRKQAALVRRGEPLNRVIAVVDGRRYEMSELSLAGDVRVQFAFERNRRTLRPAAALTQQGLQHGNAGRDEEALEAMRAAAEADPFDPHSRYLQGFALLRLRRHAEAVECYRATERLAPGWFHCRADLWLAERLVRGEIPHEVFLALHVLEDGGQPPQEKVRLAEQFLAIVPGLAPLHLLHGNALAQAGRLLQAVAAYRQGLACSPEPDVRSRMLVELGRHSDDPDERTRSYREAQAPGGNLVASAMATIALRLSSST